MRFPQRTNDLTAWYLVPIGAPSAGQVPQTGPPPSAPTTGPGPVPQTGADPAAATAEEHPESVPSQAEAPGPRGGGYDLPEKGHAASWWGPTQEGVSAWGGKSQAAAPGGTTWVNQAVPPSNSPRQ